MVVLSICKYFAYAKEVHHDYLIFENKEKFKKSKLKNKKSEKPTWKRLGTDQPM